MPNSDLPADEQARILKKALQDWMDGQFALFGKWTAAGLLSVLISGLAYLALSNSLR